MHTGRPEMAPFPDSSLSKVFLSLYLMNLSHPFSPRWSQGQMQGREHALLQHFISSLSPVSPPTCSIWGSTASHVPRGGNSQLLGPIPVGYRFPSRLLLLRTAPRNRSMMPFCSSSPCAMGAKPPQRLSPAFRAILLAGRGGKCPKWRTAFVPGLALPRCSPRNVFHRGVPGAGQRRGRDVTEQGASRHVPEAGWRCRVASW